VTAICDNAYSGNYSLVIKSCTGSKDDYCSYYGFDEIERVQLFAVETDRIANLDIYKMNITMSMQAISDKYIFSYKFLDKYECNQIKNFQRNKSRLFS